MDEEQQTQFDEAMLKVLMVEFFRDSNLPFAMADNPKFLAILQHLRPTIQVPTCSDLLQLNIDEFESFRELDKIPFLNNHSQTRRNLALKHACLCPVEDLKSAAAPPATKNPLSLFEEACKLEPISASTKLVERKPSPLLNREIKEEILFEYDDEPVERKPDQGLLGQLMVPTCSEKDHKPVKRSVKSSVLEESKPFESGIMLKMPKIEEEWTEETYNYTSGAEESPEPSGQGEVMLVDSSVSSPSAEKQTHTKDSLISFKQIPGIVRWPCLVCQERMEPIKVRAVTNNDAYFMIYLCVINGLYSLEKAKQTARMQKFQCCVKHFTSLYDTAMQHLEITDPETEITTDNIRVVDAWHVVKSIKDSRYQQKLVFEGSQKHMVPFCNALKKYFEKYRRQNYAKADKSKGN